MKTYIKISLILFTTLITFSCEKESIEEEDNFYALKVGNSWVYTYNYVNNRSDIIQHDSIPKFDNQVALDSVSIISEEIINSNTYFKFRTKTTYDTNPETSSHIIPEEGITHIYLRDSIGYLITSTGHIFFSNNNFNELKLHESGNDIIIQKTLEETKKIEIEAGFFACVQADRYAKNTSTNEPYPSTSKYNYSNNVGLISNECGYVSGGPILYQRNLLSYKLN